MSTTTNNTTTYAKRPRPLPAGARVVSKSDGEPGRVVRVGTYRRNRLHAATYVVDTAYGRETWDAGDLFVPEQA